MTGVFLPLKNGSRRGGQWWVFPSPPVPEVVRLSGDWWMTTPPSALRRTWGARALAAGHFWIWDTIPWWARIPAMLSGRECSVEEGTGWVHVHVVGALDE